MSKFKVIDKKDNTLTFELLLMKEERVSKTNVLSLIIKSLNHLCFPEEDNFHTSNVQLSNSEKELLKANNPLTEILNNSDYEFNFPDIDTFSTSIYKLHEIVENIVSQVDMVEELPVSDDEELTQDLHFKARYQAKLNNSEWIDFLPENFELTIDYMAYHDPGEPDPYDNIDMLMNEGFTQESDIDAENISGKETTLEKLLKKFGF